MIPSLKPPPTMDFQQELQTRNVYLVDDFGDEDDVFYRELRNQVLQLTAEDEEQVYENKNINMVTDQKQGFNRGPGGYYDWAGNKEDFSVPVWMLNLWRHGNGTGVFIPQVVPTKKKNKSRRKRNERGRTTYMRVEKV